MKVAACYIRVSTDDQLEYSPDSQLEKIREYASRNDYVLLDDNIFIEDEGVSGRKASKRHEFQRMINIAKSKPKPFDVIIVWKFSRFARNREDSIVYKSMLRKQLGIEVVSVSENIGDDKMSVITEAIIEAMDEYYSINLGEEVKRGMTERAKRGEWNSIAPFGYKLVDGKLEIVPEQAEIIKDVFTKYVNGWGQKRIAVWLNSIGVKSNRGGLIENRTIDYWINNPCYIGYTRWTPTGRTSRNFNNPDSLVVKGQHEPIISPELWERAQKRYHEIKSKYVKNRQDSDGTAFSLSGIIRCDNCGATLTRTNKATIYMQCSNYNRGTCTVSHFAKVNEIELLLYSTIKSDLESGKFKLERAQTAPESKSNKTALYTQIERIEGKLERIRQAYENGIDTIEEYKANKQRVTAELDELKKRAAEVGENQNTNEPTPSERSIFAKKYLDVLDYLIDPATPNEDKNRLLKEFVKSATYNKTEKKLSVIYLL